MSRVWMMCFLAFVLCFTPGCKDLFPGLYDDDEPEDDFEEEQAAAEQVEQDTSSSYADDGSPAEPGQSVPPDFAGVIWMHHNVSGWPETAHLDASVGGGSVRLDYDKANVWPEVQGVVASAWVFFIYNGAWHASTFEYMRPGQTVKSANFYIPINGTTWRPSSGEDIGFMVSGLARDRRRNVEERSNVDMVVWP